MEHKIGLHNYNIYNFRLYHTFISYVTNIYLNINAIKESRLIH